MVPAVVPHRHTVVVVVEEEVHHIPDAAAVDAETHHTFVVVAVGCRMCFGLCLIHFVDLGDMIAVGYNMSPFLGVNCLANAGDRMIVAGCSMLLSLVELDCLLVDRRRLVLALCILAYYDRRPVGRMRVALALYIHLDVVHFHCSQSYFAGAAQISKLQPFFYLDMSSRDVHDQNLSHQACLLTSPSSHPDVRKHLVASVPNSSVAGPDLGVSSLHQAGSRPRHLLSLQLLRLRTDGPGYASHLLIPDLPNPEEG
jgi:hypothetical protein